MRRLLDVYKDAIWLNPQPEEVWNYHDSIRITRQLLGERMFPLTLAVMTHGGEGIISVVSNAAPAAMRALAAAAAAGDCARARALHEQLSPLFGAACLESNPIPIKAALAVMNRIGNVLRLPLVPLGEGHAPALRAALITAGALSE